ncbi:MAG: hypothetical protein RIR70_88 [Pseudomonadota bacterium]|jgi:deoxyribodipyrimidine photolyase-related protein
MRHLILVLGDQLDDHSAALADIDPARDRVLMIEAIQESTHAPSHKARTVLFLSAMRHFAKRLQSRALAVDYLALGTHPHTSLAAALAAQLKATRPEKLIVVEPGEYRMRESLKAACKASGTALTILPDTHFLCSLEQFRAWAGDTSRLRMETFYRRMRRATGVLMQGDEPEGGLWNYDAENRGNFGKSGPGLMVPPRGFPPDDITRHVMEEVERLLPDNPGSLAHFDWPVTRDQARAALDDFITHRLPLFGRYQDAMWSREPYLYHARISAAMNLKLLDPRDAIDAAVKAYRAGHAPLESVEGFVRQIMGWREFIRGVYWLDMPTMKTANHFGHTRKLPQWYWTGETHMNCMRETVRQVIDHGYAHHIQRLMVTGQFALLAGIAPTEVGDWYLGMYTDAVEWAELPNTAGMALFSNGGRFTTKPYVASGQYIKRMSNYCAGCRYKPEVRHGEDACPMTSLYWHFLSQHQDELAKNPRAGTMLLSFKRLSEEERRAIDTHAMGILEGLDGL